MITSNVTIDKCGKNTEILKQKKLFLFDMDGTIYEEEHVFDGTQQLLKYIKDIGGEYVFITNNSSKSVDDYVNKIMKLGIDGKYDNFFTSSQATISYIKNNYHNAKVYCQGTRSLINELRIAGINITETVEKVDVVLVGFDTELTSQKLRNTCEILSTQNVIFLATNPDLRCPVNYGYIPDCGSICKLIEDATGKRPIYIGKPEPTMVYGAMNKFGYSKEDTVVVGDRLYTDIATGLNAGVTTVCVLTGEATIEEIDEGDVKPTFIFDSVKEMWLSMI